MSFLRTPGEMRALIEAAGFRTRAWEDMKFAKLSSAATGSPYPNQGIQSLIMVDDLATIKASQVRNREEERMVGMMAVLDRI
ncbi:MAG: hypothetical protein ACI906_003655 [Candidatus Latescibacterota bacterium]|jgi:hypothetical protein